MICITNNITIDESEFEFEFFRSSGPGGQNVNKVSTAVRLRFNINNTSSLSDDVKDRLIRLAGKKINKIGELIIEARRSRKQEQNRKEAIVKLIKLIDKAAIQPKVYKKSRISFASKQRRLENKKRHSQKKMLRRSVGSYDF